MFSAVVWHTDFFSENFFWKKKLYNVHAQLYDTRSQKVLQYYDTHSAAVTGLACHPLAHVLVTGSQDRTLRVLDLAEGRPIYTLTGNYLNHLFSHIQYTFMYILCIIFFYLFLFIFYTFSHTYTFFFTNIFYFHVYNNLQSL